MNYFVLLEKITHAIALHHAISVAGLRVTKFGFTRDVDCMVMTMQLQHHDNAIATS